MEHLRGFSLIEIVVVLGILLIVGACAGVFGNDALQRALARNDRRVLVAVISRARAEAQAGICTGACGAGASHGVKVILSQNTLRGATLFEGTSYIERNTAADTSFSFSGRTVYSGPNEIVFAATFATTSTTTLSTGIGAEVKAIYISGTGALNK